MTSVAGDCRIKAFSLFAVSNYESGWVMLKKPNEAMHEIVLPPKYYSKDGVTPGVARHWVKGAAAITCHPVKIFCFVFKPIFKEFDVLP